MGLDMYLLGKKYIFEDYKNPANNITEDGFRVSEKILELGYWRKHPDLHGFIVKTFAKGVDDCEPIYLSVDDLKTIIYAVNQKELPFTTGFFFGASSPDDDQPTMDILERAVLWLESEKKGDGCSRHVIYQASW